MQSRVLCFQVVSVTAICFKPLVKNLSYKCALFHLEIRIIRRMNVAFTIDFCGFIGTKGYKNGYGDLVLSTIV